MKPTTLPEIEYPESDGEPMGETGIHVHWAMRLYLMFDQRYAGQQVLIGSNLFFYWVEGEPSKCVCPDVFVVKDCAPRPFRRTFKTWEEGRVPNGVVELTSRKTRRQDSDQKPRIYAEMGIGEYFLYDPTADYLDPPLQGHRLVGEQYVRIEPDAAGRLPSEELDLFLQLNGRDLELLDRTSGEPLLTPAEAAVADRDRERLALEREREALQLEQQARLREHEARMREQEARLREQAAREREQMEREREQAQRIAAEAELARLRQRMADLGIEDSAE